MLKEQMDKTAVGFKAANLKFYSTYLANRIIIDPGHVATEITGVVRNANDQSVIAGVSILLAELGVTAVTNAQGVYQLKPVVPGTYTVKTSKAGYADYEQPGFKIKLGQVNHLDIALIPS